ncbi:MAG: arylsulfotransferase family protein [Planctomycetota bacterium]
MSSPAATRPDDRLAALEEELGALGYAAGSLPATDVSGVTVHEREAVDAGLNLVVSGHAPEVLLLDMDGRMLHRWRKAAHEVWPELAGDDDAGPRRRQRAHLLPDEADLAAEAPDPTCFRRAHLLPDGALLAIYEGRGLVKLDAAGGVVWSYAGRAHHDLDVLPDGCIVVLTLKVHPVPRLGSDGLVGENYVTYLSPEGEELRSVSILECLEQSEWSRTIEVAAAREGGLAGDIFHTNTLEYLTEEKASWTELANPGDVLVSMRSNHAIGIIDPEAGRFSWMATGSWRAQHQPVLLPSGRMLLFDNRSTLHRSRVMECDPRTLEVVWDYQADADDVFFSNTCGSVQRLDNGNTLIVESSPGRAFEMRPDHTIVWEWPSPFRAGEQRELVATLFDLVRLPPDTPVGWAQRDALR